jgi:hypothetical protein
VDGVLNNAAYAYSRRQVEHYVRKINQFCQNLAVENCIEMVFKRYVILEMDNVLGASSREVIQNGYIVPCCEEFFR